MNRRRPPRLSLDLLRGFRAAAQQLSFTRAAQELNISQSAISREVKTLEQQLGRALFVRNSRTLQLTEAGTELLRAADEALQLVDAAAERLSDDTPRLAVSTTTALASLWLVPRLGRFLAAYPGVDVRVAATNDMVSPEREHLDVAIRFVPPGWDIPDGVRAVDYVIFPVCAPSLLRRRSKPLRQIEDLARHTLLDYEAVLYGRPWSDWDQWSDGVGRRRPATAGTLRFWHYDQVVQSALQGSGVAIGKRPHLNALLARGDLCMPFGEDCIARRGHFSLVFPQGANRRAVTDRFVAWFRAELARDARAEGDAGRARRMR